MAFSGHEQKRQHLAAGDVEAGGLRVEDEDAVLEQRPQRLAAEVVTTDVTEADALETISLVEHLFETIYVANKIARDQLAKRDKLPKEK